MSVIFMYFYLYFEPELTLTVSAKTALMLAVFLPSTQWSQPIPPPINNDKEINLIRRLRHWGQLKTKLPVPNTAKWNWEPQKADIFPTLKVDTKHFLTASV